MERPRLKCLVAWIGRQDLEGVTRDPATGPIIDCLRACPELSAVLLSDWPKEMLAEYVAPLRRQVSANIEVRAARRLRQMKPEVAEIPRSDSAWCMEALASDRTEPLNGIIAGKDVAAAFRGDPKVAEVEKLSSATWWRDRGPSKRLRRQTSDYLARLNLVLAHANSLMFIDPHIDPEPRGYREFLEILVAAASRKPPPAIEIHRVCYIGSPHKRDFPDWQTRFASSDWGPALTLLEAKAEVFIWDDFHDRYLITDLVGIQMPNGFDVSHDPNDLTTWTRVSRHDRDDVQREFDPAANRHALRDRFTIGINY